MCQVTIKLSRLRKGKKNEMKKSVFCSFLKRQESCNSTGVEEFWPLSSSELFHTEFLSKEWPYEIKLLLQKLGCGANYDFCV